MTRKAYESMGGHSASRVSLDTTGHSNEPRRFSCVEGADQHMAVVSRVSFKAAAERIAQFVSSSSTSWISIHASKRLPIAMMAKRLDG